MRDAVRDVDEGRGPKLTTEEQSEADVAGELETSLNALVRTFVELHPEVDLKVTGQALLCSAAVQLMARLDMGPDDFAELARAVGRLSQDEAQALRRAVLSRGRG